MSTDAISEEEFFKSENDLLAIFGLEAVEQPRPSDLERTAENDEQIERIVTEALHEVVVRDTTTFFFKTFGVGLSGMASAVFSSLSDLTDAPEKEAAAAAAEKEEAEGEEENRSTGGASSGIDPGDPIPDDG